MENSNLIPELTYKEARGVYSKILETYPFLTSGEKQSFISQTSQLITDENAFIGNGIAFISSILKCLDNPHANVQLVRGNIKNGNKDDFYEYNIQDQVLYLRIKRWSAANKEESILQGEKLIKLCQNNLDSYDKTVIDVRGNTGGNSFGAEAFAGIFFDKDFVTSHIIRVKNGELERKPRTLNHNPTVFIDVPIVILIDGSCFSSTELFLIPFKISKRATLIGQDTRGGSANPLSLNYISGNSKIIIKIPTWRLFLEGRDEPIEITKIKPDVYYDKEDIVKYAREFKLQL